MSTRSPKSSPSGDCNRNKSRISTPTKGASLTFPECWQDHARMRLLLTEFRDRSVNPAHYDAKMKFWQDLITQYCEHKGTACFCKQDLQVAFKHSQGTPHCLDKVLEEMQRDKLLRTLAEYSYDPENTWTGWAVNSFVKRPLRWSVYKLKYSIGWNDEISMGLLQYVHLKLMKKYCKELQQSVFLSHQGELLHYEAFKELTFEMLDIEEDCLRLCLHTLHCQHKVGIEYKMEGKEQQIHLIKIPAKGNSNTKINETDHAIHNLRMTQTSLLKQLEELETEIKVNDEKVRQHVQESRRKMAKTYLRKKKLLEQKHEKRSHALHNIESLLSSVDEAQNHGEILDAYKFGSKALQKALNDSGLNYDNVHEVIAEMRDVMDTQRELEDTLANVSVSDSSAGDNEADELERELQQILGESGKEEKLTNKPAKKPIEDDNKNQAKVQITDAELLAMLEDLEVADHSPRKSVASTNKSVLSD